MITIWIILFFIAVAGLLFFKFEHHLRLFKWSLMAVVVILIFLSMSSVLSKETVDLTSPRGVMNAIYLYVGWLGETTVDLWDIGKESISLAGNAIRVNNDEKADLPEYKEPFSLPDWIGNKLRRD